MSLLGERLELLSSYLPCSMLRVERVMLLALARRLAVVDEVLSTTKARATGRTRMRSLSFLFIILVFQALQLFKQAVYPAYFFCLSDIDSSLWATLLDATVLILLVVISMTVFPLLELREYSLSLLGFVFFLKKMGGWPVGAIEIVTHFLGSISSDFLVVLHTDWVDVVFKSCHFKTEVSLIRSLLSLVL